MMLSIRKFMSFKKKVPRVVTRIRATSTFTEAEFIQNFQASDGRPRVCGRPHLPGAQSDNLPASLAEPTTTFPLVFAKSPQATKGITEETVSSTKAYLRSNLSKNGAILLRGLAIQTATDFDTFSKGLGLRSLPYVGGLGVRDGVEGSVMTASREPPIYTIEPHNEMSYLTSNWATYLWFFCETPPTSGCGGESVLVSNKDLQRDLDPEVTEKFRKLGIRYTQNLPSRTEDGYISWQEVFQSANKEVVEGLLKARGNSFKWSEDNLLSYWYKTDAYRPHHITGEEIWFNQAHANATFFRANPEWENFENVADDKMPFHTYYGDGSIIESQVLDHVRSVTWRNAIGLQLKKGDVLFLDNMAMQHGRLGYIGERRLLLCMSNGSL